jgi:hypothetical protein
MACTNCNQIVVPCVTTTPSCSSCPYTVNTDCVIYKGEVLSFESETQSASGSRTLSDLLALISNSNCCDKPSILVEGDYTILAEDVNHTILLKGFDDGVIGTITYTLTLPQTMDFANKELVFKDISVPLDTDTTTIAWVFSSALQYDWVPTTQTSVYYSSLSNLSNENNVLRLRFVKTTPTAYQWIVV